MKIVQIAPGSGGTFYCENCLRDTALIQALRAAGHDVIMTPMYLPFFLDGPDIEQHTPVFFGGINTYLQQNIPLFRHTPRWLDRLFDSRWLLQQAAKREGTTQAAGLGAMTLSMLRAEQGNQRKELQRLIAWLQHQERPDLIHISMVLLSGLAKPLKEALGVPIVCSLQDEDCWIENLDGTFADQCWQTIRQRIRHCDALLTVSNYYRDRMAERLQISADTISLVPNGIDSRSYRLAQHGEPPVMGYLSKLTPSLGLGTFIRAYELLKARPGLENLRMAAMGGLNGSDLHFVEQQRTRLRQNGMAEHAVFHKELDREARIHFLEQLRVLSVPMLQGEAFGTFMIEAWAAGVPVVQPRAGAFPELIEHTGGGRVYNGDSPQALATALEPFLRDATLARDLGARGRAVAARDYTVEAMARQTTALYEAVAASV